MTGFTDFVTTELPKRPFVADDGSAGQTLVRSANPERARELVWVDIIAAPPTASEALGGHRAVVLDASGGVRYADNTDPGHLVFARAANLVTVAHRLRVVVVLVLVADRDQVRVELL